jgi:hypothetical protein
LQRPRRPEHAGLATGGPDYFVLPPAAPAAPAPVPAPVPELPELPLSDAAPLGDPVIAPELREELVPEFIELEPELLGLVAPELPIEPLPLEGLP